MVVLKQAQVQRGEVEDEVHEPPARSRLSISVISMSSVGDELQSMSILLRWG